MIQSHYNSYESGDATLVRLKEARIAANLTQEQLSAASGIPQNTISTIENGSRKDPRISTLMQLALALGLKVDDLIESNEGDGKAS